MSVSVTNSTNLLLTVTVNGSTSASVTTTSSSVSVTEAVAPAAISVLGKGPKGDTGATGATGATGPAGADGAGLIVGGSENQILLKNSATDYDLKWSPYTMPSADGLSGQMLTTDGAGSLGFEYPLAIYENVKNVSGGPLYKGTPVHVTGSVGNLAEVIAASASSNYPAHFVLNEDLADEGEGLAVALGFINNVDVPDASIYSEGQTVYLGESGGWVTTKPTGTNAIQNLGVIIKVNIAGNKVSGIVMGAGRSNDVPNIPEGQTWIGNASGVATPTTLADVATSGAYSDLSGTPTIPVSGVDFDPVGTDNSTNVTLGGAYDYLTIVGQTITRNQVDYTTDISNTPAIPQSGVDFDPVGTDNSTNVTLAGSYDYLTLSGQQITLGQVDYNTDISNKPALLDASGTPANNQLAVWVDANTLEGESNITWDGTNFRVTGKVFHDSIMVDEADITAAGEYGSGSKILERIGSNTATIAGDLYYLAGSWVQADADAASSSSGLLAIATSTSSNNGMLAYGIVRVADNTGFSAASEGDVLYVDLTAGHVTSDVSSYTTGDVVRVVGYVIDATNRIIYFDPSKDWIELS